MVHIKTQYQILMGKYHISNGPRRRQVSAPDTCVCVTRTHELLITQHSGTSSPPPRVRGTKPLELILYHRTTQHATQRQHNITTWNTQRQHNMEHTKTTQHGTHKDNTTSQHGTHKDNTTWITQRQHTMEHTKTTQHHNMEHTKTTAAGRTLITSAVSSCWCFPLLYNMAPLT